MRARIRNMGRDKKGQILMLAILVMFVGAIILGGLFMYLDSSLSLTIKSEDQAVNYYAADSGMEDAIAWLQHKPWSQSGELAGWPDCNPLSVRCDNTYEINGRNVNVTVENPTDFGNNTFLITSTATANDSARRTTIESYVGVETLDLYRFGESAITSNCDCDTCDPHDSVEIKGRGENILGNISYVCSLDCDPSPCTFNESYRQKQWEDGIPWWPDIEELLFYFWYMAQDADYFTEDIIYVEDNPNIGPLYREGDLNIWSRAKDVDLFLDGIIYIDGNLEIGTKKEGQSFTIDLNNQTIFATGTIDVGGGCTITGSGSIIALGDINFEPDMDSGDDDFLFIMSIDGKVVLHPGGVYWGSVASAEHVQVQPGNIVGHRDPNQGGYVFPGIEPIFDIITYNITKFE